MIPDFQNGKFAVGCKADGLFITRVKVQVAQGGKVTVVRERELTIEDAKKIYEEHVYKCTNRHLDFWIWYKAPDGSWKPVKRNKNVKGGFEA